MHNVQGALDWRPSLIGTMFAAATGATFQGAPVQCNGFGEAKLIVVWKPNITGTAANLATLTLKVQEGASLTGTGTAWTDITDGEVMGSFKVALTLTNPGENQIYTTSAYERLSIGRKKCLRVHGTIDGTAGIGAVLSAGFLLGSPITTLYISNPTSIGTGSAEYNVK